MKNILKEAGPVQLPYPSTVLENTEQLKSQYFIQKNSGIIRLRYFMEYPRMGYSKNVLKY